MANFKVKNEKSRRVITSFTIKKKVKEDFSNYCFDNDLSASRIVENLIEYFLKSKE